RDLDTADQSGFLVGRNVRLVAVRRLAPAMARPTRLVIVLNAGRRDQGRVYQRARAHHEAALIELARDDLEQRSVKSTAHQLGTEVDEGRALRRGLARDEATLAYYVEWHLREAWAPILFHDHNRVTVEQERPSPVAPVQPSPAALRKRGRRRTDDGLPLSGFSDLMAHLATRTMNVIAVPGAKDAAFTTLTNPTALQNAAFRLLGTEHVRVQ